MMAVLIAATLVLATGVAGSAHAAEAETAKDVSVIHGKTIKQMIVYGWERNGKFINAVPGDGTDVPYDAAKVYLRRFVFPGGEFRELFFEKGVRTHGHENFWDTLYYTVSGRRVHFVNDQAHVNEPGDVALHPKGVQHHGEATLPTVNIEIAVESTNTTNPKATWIANRDTPETPMAAWVANGKRAIASGDAVKAAPADAGRFTAKVFSLPGYTMREVRLAKGTRIAPAPGSVNTLIYVVKGRMSVTIGKLKDEVVAGDGLREVPGEAFGIEALDDTLYFDVALPVAPK